jgi:hypothetical protein
MGNFGGLLIIGIGVIVVIMGIKGTWANLFPEGFFSNFLQLQQSGPPPAIISPGQSASQSPTQVVPNYPSNQH